MKKYYIYKTKKNSKIKKRNKNKYISIIRNYAKTILFPDFSMLFIKPQEYSIIYSN